jgi:hypothetical protein
VAVVAENANQTMRQDAALEESLDLLDHKARQGRLPVVVGDVSEECPPVRLKGLVEDGLFRTVALKGRSSAL